ncbi:hypothetical protein JCM10213_007274 [Rhodosporidiobolus nylandii]
MRHPASGFSALLKLSTSTGGRPGGATDLPLPEWSPVALTPTECTAYVEGHARALFRVFFTRSPDLKPVVGLEAYAAFLQVDEQQAFVKVYACGAGVETKHAFPWYLDGTFGDLPNSPGEAVTSKVTLSIFRCHLRPGIDLGTGHLFTKDIAKMDETKGPILRFSWHYMRGEQLELFGVLPRPSQLPPPVPPAATDSALAFLRLASRIAISLMSDEQRLAFVDCLGHSPEALALLPEDAQKELVDFRQTKLLSSSEARPISPKPEYAAYELHPDEVGEFSHHAGVGRVSEEPKPLLESPYRPSGLVQSYRE